MTHPDNTTAILATLADDPGFVGATLGCKAAEITPDLVVLTLDAGPALQQHFGGPHAAIIFGLGETSAYCLLMRRFGDLVVDQVAPLVKSGQIAYTAIARGTLTATASTPSDQEDVRAAFAGRGSASFTVDVVFSDSQGQETGTATYKMGIKRF